jgi:hypothetical protein
MLRRLVRGRLALLAVVPLLGLTLLAARPAVSIAGTCPDAYFEMQPPPFADINRGWQIPASGTWTEIFPAFGQQHPQYQFADYNLDGLINNTEGFIEEPGGETWYVAGAGTMYHLTPVELGPGGVMTPIGDPIIAYWRRFWGVNELRMDGRLWFITPDTLFVLNPACCEPMPIFDSVGGGVIGNNSPTLFAIAGPGENELLWYYADVRTCGLWVAKDLATPAARTSWGGVKIRYR